MTLFHVYWLRGGLLTRLAGRAQMAQASRSGSHPRVPGVIREAKSQVSPLKVTPGSRSDAGNGNMRDLVTSRRTPHPNAP